MGLMPRFLLWSYTFTENRDLGFTGSVVGFSTNFAKSGAYPVCGRFQVNRVVQTCAWRVFVEGNRPLRQSVIPAGALPVRVLAHGFPPFEIRVPAGGTLAVTQEFGVNCGRELVVPDLGLASASR